MTNYKMSDQKEVRIVILHRGWVKVGYYSEDYERVTMTKTQTIRVWGTTKGLGELRNGPTNKTVLDPCGVTKHNVLGEIDTIVCDASKWEKYLVD
jgi:hypothetical protein